MRRAWPVPWSGKDGEEVGFVEGDVELAVDRRAGSDDVGDVEEAGRRCRRGSRRRALADGGARAVAAGEVGGRAGFFGAVGKAEVARDVRRRLCRPR